MDFATEAGLVALIHNDIDTPFSKEGQPPAYLAQIKALFRRHPNATIIWAHIGVGRRCSLDQAAIIEEILSDPTFNNVYLDISARTRLRSIYSRRRRRPRRRLQ